MLAPRTYQAADLTTGSVHVNAPLTNLAIKFPLPDFVAERVFPVIPVNKESDVYYIFNREELLDYDDLRAAGAESNEIAWDVDTDSYLAEEYALKYLVPKRVADNSDPPVRPAMTAVEKLKQALMLRQERRVQAIVQSAAIITNNATPAINWDAAGAIIETDVDNAKNQMRLNSGLIPNAILMNYQVSHVVKRWLKATAYTTFKEWLDQDKLPPVLWDMETVVAGAVRNTANAAAAEVLADVWNDNVLLFFKQPSPSIDSVALGYIFRAQNWMTVDWWENARKGTFYEVSVIQDELLTAVQAGYLLIDVIS
jgi:hypothetical protein